MKNFLFNIIQFLLFAMALSSCIDNIQQQNVMIEEGREVEVAVGFGINSPDVISRSSLSNEREQTLSGFYLFVFNSDGSLDNKKFYNTTGFPNTTGKGTVTIGLHSGYNKKFYAVGNPNTGAGNLSEEVLNDINTEEALLVTTSRLNTPYNVERNMLLMSGKMEAAQPGDQINIDEQGQIIGAEKDDQGRPVIKLYRTDAKITFNIKGKNTKYTNFEFSIKNYWVENIPQGTNVFMKEGVDYESPNPDDKPTYASMSTYSFKKVYDDYKDGTYSFTFYIPENRLKPQKNIEASTELIDGQTHYSLREKRSKTSVPENPLLPGKTEENGDFVYANKNSTYVVFEGTISYVDETVTPNRFVYANAIYTIHLGASGYNESLNEEEKIEEKIRAINDYYTSRNSHYIYEVTVTDVNSMIVEVKEEKEKNPGVEGDVIVAGNEVKSMDAHYGRTYFKLTKGAILEGLSWAISTPFQKGLKVFDKEKFAKKEDGGYKTEDNYTDAELKKLQITGPDKLHDYKWVQFMVNQELKFEPELDPTEAFAKYPGYSAYDGGQGKIANGGTAAPPFGGEGLRSPSYNYDLVKLYDIDQLINHLFLEAQKKRTDKSYIFVKSNNESDDYVVVTAFVDEYIYKYDPTEYYYQTPNAVLDSEVQNLLLWKKAVNGDNRMLHFCEQGNFYSPDGNTTLAETVVTISQAPVYTFYNQMDNELKTAWGVESINETGRLRAKTINQFPDNQQHVNTQYNGRENTLKILSPNLKWDEVMFREIDNYGKLKYPYDEIWYACFGRNRDLDGDNIIDEDEIRWYLASIDQLTDLWIGQYSLPQSTWMYPEGYFEKNERPYWHLASSSYYNNDPYNPWVLWAEEGASRGEYSYSHSYVNNLYDYRCVRNLGLSLKNISEYPEYYTDVIEKVNMGIYKEYIIKMSKLEGKSVRTARVIGNQDKHHERMDINRPYKAMAVLVTDQRTQKAVTVYPTNVNEKKNFLEYQNYNNNPCPPGYRIPNQREMMLMYTTLTTDRISDLPFKSGAGYASGETFWSYSGDAGDNLVTFTQFGYKGKGEYGDNRLGFLYDQKRDLILEDRWSPNYRECYVRCVRDVILE